MRWIDRLLVFIAVLVALASFMPLGAKLTWVLELSTHFRVQYLIATVVVLALVALRRRWGAGALLVAAGAVNAAALLPYLPRPGAVAVAETPAPLKVLTVNVSFRPFSTRRLLEIIREADPDVLIVQELTPHAERELAPLDEAFAHYRKFPSDGAYGIGLWSKLTLESSAMFALGRRPAIEARLEGPSGAFTVFGVHLSAPTSARRAAARNRELAALAEMAAGIDEPLVVAGDFNVTPYSPYFQDWLAASGLTDSRRGRTMSISWPTMLPVAGIPIDHVAVNDGFAVLSHRRLANFESDHYGVLVELAARSPRATEQP